MRNRLQRSLQQTNRMQIALGTSKSLCRYAQRAFKTSEHAATVIQVFHRSIRRSLLSVQSPQKAGVQREMISVATILMCGGTHNLAVNARLILYQHNQYPQYLADRPEPALLSDSHRPLSFYISNLYRCSCCLEIEMRGSSLPGTQVSSSKNHCSLHAVHSYMQ